MSHRIVTQPATEPVTLAQFKARLDITTTDRDTELTALLLAARQWCEQYCWSSFIETEHAITLPGFPASIRLPFGPLLSIESIEYVDTSGATQTLAATQYDVVVGNVAHVLPAYNVIWPVTRSIEEAVTVTYLAGYGDATGDVPEAIKQAIIVYAMALFEGECHVPMATKALLGPWRLIDTRTVTWVAR